MTDKNKVDQQKIMNMQSECQYYYELNKFIGASIEAEGDSYK